MVTTKFKRTDGACALAAGPDLHSANISLKGQIVNIILGFVGQKAKLRVLCTYITNKTKQTEQLLKV